MSLVSFSGLVWQTLLLITIIRKSWTEKVLQHWPLKGDNSQQWDWLFNCSSYDFGLQRKFSVFYKMKRHKIKMSLKFGELKIIHFWPYSFIKGLWLNWAQVMTIFHGWKWMKWSQRICYDQKDRIWWYSTESSKKLWSFTAFYCQTGVNFTNILWAAFSYESFFAQLWCAYNLCL